MNSVILQDDKQIKLPFDNILENGQLDKFPACSQTLLPLTRVKLLYTQELRQSKSSLHKYISVGHVGWQYLKFES